MVTRTPGGSWCRGRALGFSTECAQRTKGGQAWGGGGGQVHGWGGQCWDRAWAVLGRGVGRCGWWDTARVFPRRSESPLPLIHILIPQTEHISLALTLLLPSGGMIFILKC